MEMLVLLFHPSTVASYLQMNKLEFYISHLELKFELEFQVRIRVSETDFLKQLFRITYIMEKNPHL